MARKRCKPEEIVGKLRLERTRSDDFGEIFATALAEEETGFRESVRIWRVRPRLLERLVARGVRRRGVGDATRG